MTAVARIDPAGTGSPDEVTTIFEWTTPQTSAVIVHNLGAFPSVTVVDSAGSVIEVSKTYDSNNQITLQWTAAFAGKAYLNV